MTDETETLPGSGEASAPAADTAVPKNDAEAAAQDAQKAEEEKRESKPDEAQAKRKNRTTEYIERLKGEAARARELERKLAELEARLPKPEGPKPPDPKDFYEDPIGFTKAQAEFQVMEARRKWEEEQRAAAKQAEEQRLWQSYQERALKFAAEHEDFEEVVNSVRFPLAPEVQAAIAAHESGPAIAYHIGLNAHDAFLLAQTKPELAQFAVELIASRMKAAPEVPSPPAATAETPKPISQAPAPPPRVGGRSPTEVPKEKMTDEEWYRAEQERRRKR